MKVVVPSTLYIAIGLCTSLSLLACEDDTDDPLRGRGDIGVDAEGIAPPAIGSGIADMAVAGGERGDAAPTGGGVAGMQAPDDTGGVMSGLDAGVDGGPQGGGPSGGQDGRDVIGPCGDLPYRIGEVVVGNTFDGASQHVPECGPSTSPEAVFRVEVDQGGDVCLSTEGSAFDTILQVRASRCDGPVVVCSDDGVEGVSQVSRLSFEAAVGTTYFVYIDGYEQSAGEYKLASRFGDCRGAILPECDDDNDCGRDQVCDAGVCADPPEPVCMDNTECEAGFVCNPRQQCVEPNRCGNGIEEAGEG
ncbi:MAG: PPC domain-containing protein, partial [Myxococcota bacterium]|nr:PPC domain-containing protein [Myxococcota bacterium]